MQHLPHRSIGFLTTGGTIDKIYPEGRSVREFAFSDESALRGVLRQIRFHERARHQALLPQDSLDMDPYAHALIAETCAQMNKEGIVITHGTDKMIETAEYIARRELKKTVVLTGASQPACVAYSDAATNIASAIIAAKYLPHGVYIVMHGEAHLWNECKKTETGRFVPVKRPVH